MDRAANMAVGAAVVSTVLDLPPSAWALLVLAHGAGAGMRHPFMQDLAAALVERGIAVFRFQFPFLEAGRRRVDGAPLLEETVRAAVAAARTAAPGLPAFAGGKSLGARMSTRAAARPPGLEVRGLVCFGFPLHPAGRPGTKRAAHLPDVPQPLLLLQGTRDALADLELMRGVAAGLPRAELHVVEGADHGFAVLRRSGRTSAEVLRELADAAAAWLRERAR